MLVVHLQEKFPYDLLYESLGALSSANLEFARL